MNKLVVILGAGFSKPAGLPLAREIQERFDRNQKRKLLQFGSSEWQWIDVKDESTINNGHLGFDWLPYSYILNESINKYKEIHGEFDTYENFYQWTQDILFNKLIKEEIYNKSESELVKDYPHLLDYVPEYEGDISPYLYRFQNDSDLSNLRDIVNYLIADLLGFSRLQFQNSISEYKKFIDYIKEFRQVEIFSLNHDLLLENLFEYFALNYSRGFSKDKSEIRYQDDNTPIAVFKDSFSTAIRLHKLHGSLDFFRFEHFAQGNKIYLESTGNYNYFTTRNYREKHYAIRVNPETGETIQDLNFDIVPKFITGTNKTKVIKNDLMYRELFSRFEQRMSEASKILISGYSFSDKHINQELQKRSDLEIINQNPSVNYPFEAKQISNIQTLNNLTV